MSYRKISLSVEAARLTVYIIASLWILTGTSEAVLPRCLSNFRAIKKIQDKISQLRDLTRSYDKTSSDIESAPGVLILPCSLWHWGRLAGCSHPRPVEGLSSHTGAWRWRQGLWLIWSPQRHWWACLKTQDEYGHYLETHVMSNLCSKHNCWRNHNKILTVFKNINNWDLVTHICVGELGHHWYR